MVHTLTVNVKCHGAGDGGDDVVVGGLTRENDVEVFPLETLDVEHIPHLPIFT